MGAKDERDFFIQQNASAMETVGELADKIAELTEEIDGFRAEVSRLRRDVEQKTEEITRLSRVLEVEQEGHAEDLARAIQAAVAAEQEVLITRALEWAARCKTGPVTKDTYVDTGQLWRTHGWNVAMDYVIERLPVALRAPTPAPPAGEDGG